jgi:alginate O-acetyltransferase complex protein AlgI
LLRCLYGFSSALFLTFFLPLVLGTYFLARDSLRNYVLLFASLLFYSWGEPIATLIMIVLIFISYFLAICIENNILNLRKTFLALGVTINLAVLFFYKYWMFFLTNTNLVLENLNFSPVFVPQIALPIGISFYIFQIISYLIDVYRQQVKAQSNFFMLATYVSLFPQLIAGPIVRYETIENDLKNRKNNLNNIFIGLRRFVIGLAKKVLIADQVALIADKVFDTNVDTVPCFFAWIGVFAYTLQIYFDFSAYSDMAIGLGRIFNFNFLENFNYPYSSCSIQEFWRKWHISLSSWFRDYLYIPLGGNRKGNLRTYLNCYIVFGLCGLWHGSSWNFVIWGLYHGTGLIIERIGFKSILERLPRMLSNLYVWLFVMIGWVLFRAETLTQAYKFIKIMFTGNPLATVNSFTIATDFLTYSNIIVCFIGVLLSYPIFTKKYNKFKNKPLESFGIFILFLISLVFATTSTFSPFIYFRF